MFFRICQSRTRGGCPPARGVRGSGARTRFLIPSDGVLGRQRTARASAASPGAGADSIKIAGVKTMIPYRYTGLKGINAFVLIS